MDMFFAFNQDLQLETDVREAHQTSAHVVETVVHVVRLETYVHVVQLENDVHKAHEINVH